MNIEQAIIKLNQWLAQHADYAAFIDSPMSGRAKWKCELANDFDDSHVGFGETIAEAIEKAIDAYACAAASDANDLRHNPAAPEPPELMRLRHRIQAQLESEESE